MSPSPLAWALHSPLRFVAVLGAGVLLLVVVAWVGLGSASSREDHRASGERPLAEEPAVPTTTSSAMDHSDDEGEPIGPAAQRTVERFLRRYLAPTSRGEIEQLRPLCTPDLWAGLKIADPAKMPRGPVRRVDKVADGAFSASFSVDLPSTSLLVDVVVAPGGLRVSSVEPEKS